MKLNKDFLAQHKSLATPEAEPEPMQKEGYRLVLWMPMPTVCMTAGTQFLIAYQAGWPLMTFWLSVGGVVVVASCAWGLYLARLRVPLAWFIGSLKWLTGIQAVIALVALATGVYHWQTRRPHDMTPVWM